jgi:single-stranded-DNA-specific exonuclease
VFYDLRKDEIQRLTEKIIQKRKQAGIANPEDVFSNVYIIEGEEHGHFRDAKEFSTLLNSCGRMDNATLGIGACLGDERQRKESLKILLNYKHEIINSMNWYHKNCSCENCGNSRVIKGHNYIIINAKDEVMSTMIGTLASMISKKNDFEKNIFVLSMARNDEATTKISLRISGNPQNVDLKSIMSELIAKVGGEAGGHQFAAGAIINIETEEQFIEEAKEIFEREDNR